MKNRDYTRRLFLAISRIDGVYYLLGKKSGIKENVLVLLYALDDGIPRTQKQICEEWNIPKTTINTSVKECVAAGYVDYVSGNDGREKKLILTDSGKHYTREVLGSVESLENKVIKKVLSQCGSEFIEALEQYADIFQSEAEKILSENPK